MANLSTSTVARRVGFAERFAHRAMAIVDTALLATARRNERGVAGARLVISVAFALRLILVFPRDVLDGHFKDWFMLTNMGVAALLSAVFLAGVGSHRFSAWQRTFVVLDLVLVAASVFPAVIWTEPAYRGLLTTPFAGVGTLVAVSGGLRLNRGYAVFTSVAVLTLWIMACILDLNRNADAVAWGVSEVAYYAIELGGAALLGVLVATRTLDLATRSAAKAIEAERAREHLGAYVGREVAEEALRLDEIVLGGSRQPVAVLFSDLRGFTASVDRLDQTVCC